MFTDFRDEDYLRVAIVDLADEFLKSRFNAEISSDAHLEFCVGEFLKSMKLNVKHAKKITDEILRKQQSRVNYGFG